MIQIDFNARSALCRWKTAFVYQEKRINTSRLQQKTKNELETPVHSKKQLNAPFVAWIIHLLKTAAIKATWSMLTNSWKKIWRKRTLIRTHAECMTFQQ